MNVNVLPRFDDSVNTTGCCPRFNPEGWDGQELHFKDKRFLRAETKSALHIPLNMGRVFTRVMEKLQKAKAFDPKNTIVLSRDLSPWKAEHLFATSAPVPGEEMVTLSGNFVTRVFEGGYREMGGWKKEMDEIASARGGDPENVYFYYTTCPKCAKAYGRNYVVGVARIR